MILTSRIPALLTSCTLRVPKLHVGLLPENIQPTTLRTAAAAARMGTPAVSTSCSMAVFGGVSGAGVVVVVLEVFVMAVVVAVVDVVVAAVLVVVVV